MSTYSLDLHRAVARLIQPPSALRALPAAPYPDRYYEYFYQRGITPRTMAQVKTIALTRKPGAVEKAWYEQHLYAPRCNTMGEPAPIGEGIGFEYYIDEEKYGPFARTRNFTVRKEFAQYYRDQGQKVPKVLSPSGKKVKETSHLYLLPQDKAKLNKITTAACIIEGEAKLLALSQDCREFDNDTQTYAAIGISGVDQFLSAPEIHNIQWRNRVVFLFFDADSFRKPQVAQAELKIAAWMLSRGVKAVRSCVWPETAQKAREPYGNGYDDFQVNAALRFPRSYTLQRLFKKSLPALRKYAGSDDTEGLPLDTYCRAFGRVPDLKGHHTDILVEELTKIFQKQGVKRKAIKDLLHEEQQKAQQEERQEDIEAAKQRIMQDFQIAYMPDLPDNFYARNGSLSYIESPICNMFVVKKYIATNDPDTEDYYLLKFRGRKEIEIPSSEFTQYKKIAERFNRNREILDDNGAKLIQRFIAGYWMRNKHKPIPIVHKYVNTGWEDGAFRLPTLDVESEYENHIKERFYQDGDPDLQRAFLAELYQTHHAAFYDLCAKAAPLISLLNMPNCIVMTSGTGGGGKTTGALLALSQYGNHKKLKFTMDSTKTGKELVCSLYKDMPILIDEMNTAGDGDGTKTAAAIISTIYGFESGHGKIRGTSNVTLRKVNDFQGLLFLTSEKSLDTILTASKNLVVGGAYRRVLEIPVRGKHTLWNFEDTQEKSFFDTLYRKFSENFGYTGAAWLRHISDPHVQHSIKERYAKHLEDIGQKWTLKGTENLICLVQAIMPEVETLLDLPQGTIQQNLGDFIESVLEYNQQQVEYQIQNTVERFLDCLDDFMSDNTKSFDGLCPREELINKIYGKYEEKTDSEQKDIWLRTTAMDLICNEYGLNKNALLHQLDQEHMLETTTKTIEKDDTIKTQTVWTVNKWIVNKAWKTYHFKINYPEPEIQPGSNEENMKDFVDAATDEEILNTLTSAEQLQWTYNKKITEPVSELGAFLYRYPNARRA